ncbi:uncharacterized protein TNCV_2033561 [Trichonephila clavipes]|nr:uncharacterized protein TNCV_2033561 [Trichonephila clavipes]
MFAVCGVPLGGKWCPGNTFGPRFAVDGRQESLNSCRGVISETNLLYAPETEILESSQTSCHGQLTCSRCASVVHSSTDCTLEPKCMNCSQPHSADSKLCPKWKTEKQIQEIKINKHLTYLEARKLIAPPLSQTYSQAVKSSITSSSTQTDETITKIKCPPLKLLHTTSFIHLETK